MNSSSKVEITMMGEINESAFCGLTGQLIMIQIIAVKVEDISHDPNCTEN